MNYSYVINCTVTVSLEERAFTKIQGSQQQYNGLRSFCKVSDILSDFNQI
jgi:hypothetical protein